MGRDGTNQSQIETCGPFDFLKLFKFKSLKIDYENIRMPEYSSKKCEALGAAGLKIQISDVNVSFEIKARSAGLILIRYSHIFVTKYHAENHKKILLSKSKSKIKMLRF